MKNTKSQQKRNDPNVNYGLYLQDREAKRKSQTVLPYDLGGKTDPHFQDHGGNFIPDRIAANEEQYDALDEAWYPSLRDDGRSDGYGESYSERNI